ncbi:MAG: ArsR family transcriptional regulator [Thermoplasmata archaeon]
MAEVCPTAHRVQDLIRSYPGLHLREVARRLDLDVRAANHHLERLAKDGSLTVRYFGKHKRYFPRRGKDKGEIVDRRDKVVLAQLRNPVRLALVVHLMALGPSRLRDVSQRAGITPSRASFHLRKLERGGVVRQTTGTVRLYRVEKAEQLQNLLRRFPPMPDLVDDFVDLWKTLTPES